MRAEMKLSEARGLARRIEAWFAANARDLPWRRTREPYAVWISEIMLQQTQVATVIPYYERWMRELPAAAALAAAGPERVAKLWEGLGYYRRARHAQAAAQIIVDKYRGRFPRRFEEVLALPGIGRYTAGAICSIAFGERTAILDGNVIRVLARLRGVTGDPRSRETNARLWRLAEALVAAAADASALNQGLMELGALVCAPRSPACAACPVRGACVARKSGRVETLPELPARAAATRRRFAAFVARRGERFLVRQRPDGVVNARLWEFPNVELGAADEPALAPFARLAGGPVHRVRHSITSNRILLEAYAARVEGRAPRGAVWRTAAELEEMALTAAHRKALQFFRSAGDKKIGARRGRPKDPPLCRLEYL